MSDSIHTTRTITHEEAREIAQRLINSHFHQSPGARVGIPARPDYDDDLLIHAYIDQQAATAVENVNLRALLERAREALSFYSAGFTPRLTKRYGGLEYKPTEALLNDCGNRAAAVVREIEEAPEILINLATLAGATDKRRRDWRQTMSEIPDDIIERAAELHCSLNLLSYLSFVPPEGAELIERALLGERLAERERCAKVAERDVDWAAFGKRDIEQWDGGPDAVRDYRIGIAAGRAIAAAIRRGDTP